MPYPAPSRSMNVMGFIDLSVEISGETIDSARRWALFVVLELERGTSIV
jgi:hypothetical protein